MSGLQMPTLHGLGNLKATSLLFGLFRSFFLRFRLLISSIEASMIASAIAFCSSTSCIASVTRISAISVFFKYFSRSSLNIFLDGIFVSISFASCIKCEFFSIFRLTTFFTDRASFTDEKSGSSFSIYFCFSYELRKNVIDEIIK